MPPKLSRVLGPYQERSKWRLVVFEGEVRKSMYADSAEEAQRLKDSLLALFHDRSRMTIGTALDEYFEEKRRTGVTERWLYKLDSDLRSFLPQEVTLAEITPQRAAKMYLDETEREGRFGKIRAATHQLLLRSVKAFFEWAVARGYLNVNPFRAVKPIGKAKRGKLQLREDEARKLSDLLFAKASQGDEGALALYVQLLMGLRSAEVLNLRVRDVDGNGYKLVVEGTKTENARRRLPIKFEPLRALLLRRCEGRKPDDLVFGTGRATPYFTDFLWDRLRKYCKAAGVPVVCPHSLRGLHASLAVSHGASTQYVAEALGHANDEITRRHYIAPEALRQASLSRVADALATPLAESAAPDLEKLGATLRALAPEHLAKLLASVAGNR